MKDRHSAAILAFIALTGCNKTIPSTAPGPLAAARVGQPTSPGQPTPSGDTRRTIEPLAIKNIVEGLGSTFAEPVYQLWFSQYRPKEPVKFYYNIGDSPGSEEGILKMLRAKVHFAGSDWPLTDEEETALMGPETSPAHIYVPAIIGAVVPIYQLRDASGNEISDQIKFTAKALAGIYDGRITKWDNPAIQGVNQNIRLPRSDIHVIKREDGSGTTYLLTMFLKRQGGWNGIPGMTIARRFRSVKGSQAMVDEVKNSSNSIGYVEYSRAAMGGTNMRFGSVLNQESVDDGGVPVFANPNPNSVIAAVPQNIRDRPVQNPQALAISLITTQSRDAYPISGITWFVVPTTTDDRTKSILGDFLCWMLDSGQMPARSIGYAQLPLRVRRPAKEDIEGYFGKCQPRQIGE